jgi:low temperature requirement protein LtrA
MIVPSLPHAPDEAYAVTPLELFFDLVFVFAVSQLSHHLLEHLTWRGAAETLVLLVAVFGVWSYTSFEATMLHVGRSQPGWIMLAVMLVGLFMNAAIAHAFDAGGLAFVVPLLVIQVGRSTWVIGTAPTRMLREHYAIMLVWIVASAPLWIVGALVEPEARLLWWTLAAGLDLIGTWLAHPVPGRVLHSENVEFDADHMLERCRLLLIIALGETVLTTGTAIAAAPLTPLTVVTGTVALAGTVALWALGFGRAVRLTVQHLEATRDPIRASRYAVNALIGMVAGLIAVAVANEMVIADPQGPASVALSLLLYGGPLLYLLAQGWYVWAVPKVRPRLHLLGGAALGVLGVATASAPPSVALMLVGASLTILAMLDQR